MKTYLVVSLLIFKSAFAFAQQADLLFLDDVHKFPKTEAGVILTHAFAFVNTGEAPLVINEAKVACTCTSINYPKTPIMPADTAQLVVTFNTSEVYGWQDRIVEISSNAKSGNKQVRYKVMVKAK